MVIVESLVKQFQTTEGTLNAVDSVRFHVKEGAFYTLLGPSGCGKTTTLRCVAGLENPDSGSIRIGGKEVFSCLPKINVPTSQRSIGMVFQSYAIWPHMTVYQNVVYPLRAMRVGKAESRKRVDEALKIVGLSGLASRPAPRLSGGQQQRVALARALVAQPKVLLLDEPLSNLDAKLRIQMRVELKRLQSQLGITTIYVTHDQQEALTMSDIIALMNKGKIIQEGPPETIYSQPKSRFAAEFIGTTNIIPGQLPETERAGGVGVETVHGKIMATLDADTKLTSKRVILSFRPEIIRMNPLVKQTEDNCLSGRVEHVEFLGESIEHRVRIGKDLVIVKDPQSARFPVGAEVNVTIPSAGCRILPDDQI